MGCGMELMRLRGAEMHCFEMHCTELCLRAITAISITNYFIYSPIRSIYMQSLGFLLTLNIVIP